MNNAQPKIIHVVQGEYAISDQPEVVLTTVLGSCVSACLFDPVRQIGGMNHFLLPDSGPHDHDIRYSAAAMERLVNGLMRQGASRARLQAKLFGGARILSGLPDIGQRNAEAARRYLNDEGISLIKEDLCGDRARRIRFWPVASRVQMILLKATTPQPQEKPTRLKGGDFELF